MSPFGALDAITKEKMQVDLMRLLVTDTDRQRTVLFVTHDLEEAIFLADRVAVMTSRPGNYSSCRGYPLSPPKTRFFGSCPMSFRSCAGISASCW